MVQAPAFEDITYWERRYRQELCKGKRSEWYQDGAAAAEAVLGRVLACCRGAASLVELGCGSSGLTQRARALGFLPVLATDVSQAAMQLQLELRGTGQHRGGDLALVDCTRVPCRSSAFDYVLDKSVAVQGTLDALDCAGRAADALRKVARVLRAGGHYVLVSCRDPDVRLPLAQQCGIRMQAVQEVRGRGSSTSPCPNAHVYHLVAGA